MNFIKYPALILILTLSTFCAYSKNLFIQPWIGAGVTGSNEPYWTNDHAIHATTGGVRLGYSFSRISIGIGAGLLNTGLGLKGMTFVQQYNPQTGLAIEKVDVKLRYSELFIPVTVGIKVFDAGKFTILPEVGVAPTYTLRYNGKQTNQTTGKEVKTVSTTLNERFSLLALGAINIRYNLHRRLGIALTPTYYRMLNDLTNLSSSPNRYAITANVGLVLTL